MKHSFSRRNDGYCECVREGCGIRVSRIGNSCEGSDSECRGKIPDDKDIPYSPKPDDSPNKNLKPRPNKVRLALNFAKAFTNHLLVGMPTLSEEDTLRRVEVCSGCDKFQPMGVGKGYCSVQKCGCNIKANIEDFMNAANWEDKKCPHEKGNKWAMNDEELTAIGHPEVEAVEMNHPVTAVGVGIAGEESARPSN